MENFKKKMYVSLAINVKDYINCVSKPSFLIKIDKIFNKNFVAIHEIKPVLTLDKPIYAGFSILDLSKLLMYEVHYNYIKKNDANDNATLLFTDTDSLVYEIETDDVYEELYRNKNLFDFSDYRQDSKFFNPANKNVIGKMKDEFKGKIIHEFIGLKSNMYSLIDVDGKENKKAKGINKNVLKNKNHIEYINFLINKKIIRNKIKRI